MIHPNYLSKKASNPKQIFTFQLAVSSNVHKETPNTFPNCQSEINSGVGNNFVQITHKNYSQLHSRFIFAFGLCLRIQQSHQNFFKANLKNLCKFKIIYTLSQTYLENDRMFFAKQTDTFENKFNLCLFNRMTQNDNYN
ncbi:hypothetical protein BpHYR1_020698 [Brachionus plicatilis]|uniref:Uncharacterized protein n=1 Tax=Brachionus plicatilis TaxID=10195 RepID=A0A3M7PGF1_BRAPC|nr:hypothetical protein BpHYR1_020698 [Brachionus plicatilis]